MYDWMQPRMDYSSKSLMDHIMHLGLYGLRDDA